MDIVKTFKIIALVVVGLYLLIGCLLILFQEKLLFVPQPLSDDFEYQFPGNFESIFLETDNGNARLNALHFKTENPKGVMLYFHGNAGHLADWGWVVQDFVKRNYDVVVMDYRGYGKSRGAMSQEALYNDAQLFYEYVAKKYDDREIVVYGRSLGTTFATYVAAKNNPSKLILEAPFYNMKKLASEMFKAFPVTLFLKYPFPTDQYLLSVSCPVYFFHGTDDKMIDVSHSESLLKLLPASQTTLFLIPNGTHNDLMRELAYQKYLTTVL